MKILSKSQKIHSFSVYPWGSGFCYWIARIFDIDSHDMKKLKENLDHSPSYELLREMRMAVYNESQKRKLGTLLKASLDKVTNFLHRN